MLRSWLSVHSRYHPRMVLASTLVRGLVVLSTSHPTTSDFSFTVPCDFNTPFSVYVGGKEVKISPESFNLGPISPGSNTCLAGASFDATLEVEFATRTLASDNLPVDKADLDTAFWILGDVFLQNAYTAWDVSKGRIGFADLVASSSRHCKRRLV